MSKDNTNGAESQPKKRKHYKLEEVEEALSKLFKLRRDEVSGKVYMYELVYDETKRKWEPVNEDTLYRRLHHNDTRASEHMIRKSLGSDYVKLYNPIKKYLNSVSELKIDYDPIEKLFDYVVTPDKDLAKQLLINWMVNAIESIHNPNHYNKRVLIFFNQIQDSGKTHLTLHFVPNILREYSMVNNLKGKDGKITLTNSFIHVLDEMEGMRQVGKQEFKSIISLSYVNVRWPYQKQPTLKPRITSFLGTADRQSFLPEDTGTSRFFVLELNEINFEYSTHIPTDHLWAKAMEYHKKGEHLVLSSDVKVKVEEINKRFIQGTFTSELLLDFFLPGTEEEYDEHLTTTEIARILEERGRVKVNTKILGQSLGNLKFIKKSRSRKLSNGKSESRHGYFVRNVLTQSEES